MRKGKDSESRFLYVSILVAKLFDCKTAVYLAALIEQEKSMLEKREVQPNGSFSITLTQMRENYFFSIQEQRTARRKLVESGVLIIERKKWQHNSNLYRIDYDRLNALIGGKG